MSQPESPIVGLEGTRSLYREHPFSPGNRFLVIGSGDVTVNLPARAGTLEPVARGPASSTMTRLGVDGSFWA